MLLMARSLRDLGQPEGAIVLLEKAMGNAGPAPLQLHIEYLQLVRQARGTKAALQVARELGERFPDEPQVLSELAKTFAEDGQMDQAIQVAQRALRTKGSTDPLNQRDAALLHYQLGTLLSQAGQLDQAIHHLVQAIQANPEFIDPYLELGRVHQGRRQHNQALSTFTQAIAAAPNDARPYYHAGMALKENKDYVEAEKMLRRACELDPENVSVHRLLGAVVTLNMVHNRREPAMVG
jgi:tetratricopeptide (TPR) repeat protein